MTIKSFIDLYNTKTFNNFFDLNYSNILKEARCIVGEFKCEDIAAETFLKFYKRNKTFETIEDASHYLLRITRNTCFTYLNKYNKEKSALTNLTDYIYSINDDRHEEMISTIKELIDLYEYQLTRTEKLILKLSFKENMKAEEISQLLNIDISLVYSYRSKLKQHLIKILVPALINLKLIPKACSL